MSIEKPNPGSTNLALPPLRTWVVRQKSETGVVIPHVVSGHELNFTGESILLICCYKNVGDRQVFQMSRGFRTWEDYEEITTDGLTKQ